MLNPNVIVGPLVIVAATLLGGCRSASTEIIPKVPQAALTDSNAWTIAELEASVGRLRSDMPRAARKMYWGVRSVRVGDGKQVELDAQAPDERLVRVIARPRTDPADDDAQTRFEVSVRVGVEGDPRLAATYIHGLEQYLAGSALRRRGGGFRLPEGY